jgi:hypothetical protein
LVRSSIAQGARLESRTLVAHAFLFHHPVVSFFPPEPQRRSAFKTIMGELGGAWLNLKRVDADWVADLLMATMDEFVLDQDQAMKALSKLQGGANYEGKELVLVDRFA